MSRRSLDFSSKLSRLDSFLDNFLMPGAGGKGKGGSKAPPREEPPSVAIGEEINTMRKIWRGGKEKGRRTSPAAKTSGVFWWLHRQPLPRYRGTSG
jgi:hypothetical protein